MRAPHLGLAGERCPACGHVIETLLDSHGRNPLRMCWRCNQESIERDEAQQKPPVEEWEDTEDMP
jgi:hypothetical protein